MKMGSDLSKMFLALLFLFVSLDSVLGQVHLFQACGGQTRQIAMREPSTKKASSRKHKGIGCPINKFDGVQTTDAFLRTARVLVSELSFMFLMLFCSNFQKFNLCVTDRRNGRTDIPSYRDARTHLKIPRYEQQVRRSCFGEDI